jgi:hypothetical protein
VVSGNMFNTFVNPIALDSIGWNYYFVFVAVLIAYEITLFLEKSWAFYGIFKEFKKQNIFNAKNQNEYKSKSAEKSTAFIGQ